MMQASLFPYVNRQENKWCFTVMTTYQTGIEHKRQGFTLKAVVPFFVG